MLGSVKGVKSENPKREEELRKWEGGDLNNLIMESKTLNLNN